MSKKENKKSETTVLYDKKGRPITKKQLWLRAIAFVLVGLIAVGAFTITFINLGGYDEGYNQVKGATNNEVPLYENGISFYYYLNGSSMDMKQKMNYLKAEYTNVLSRLYILIDSKREYMGYTNIYSLNNNLGTEFQVSDELYDILYDAYERTLEKDGYNMFSGALFAEWYEILILSNFEEYDPLYNDKEDERIKKISEVVSNLNNFDLQFRNDGNKYVTFNCSKEYLDFVKEYELESFPIIDLNLLSDAYKIDYLSSYFKKIGYTDGYVTSASGLIHVLNETGIDTVCTLYGLDEENKNVIRATCNLNDFSNVSIFKSFAYSSEEVYYHTISDGKVIYRHPNISANGECLDLIQVSMMLRKDNIIDTCYQNIVLYNMNDANDINSYISSNIDVINAYILNSDNILHISENAKDIIKVN